MREMRVQRCMHTCVHCLIRASEGANSHCRGRPCCCGGCRALHGELRVALLRTAQDKALERCDVR
jgi:hypothetical protein